MSELYTSSRLKVFRQCMRLHFYRYVLGIAGDQSAKAHFGTVAHSALEAWYVEWKRLGEQVPADVRHQFQLGAALDEVRDSDLSPWDKARLSSLITAYHLRWKDARWEILAVEIEFRYELGGYLLGGKIDALIRDLDDGLVYVVEHKSTGMDASAGSSYWEKLSIDSQVSIYVDGATMLGHDIAGCIYDVLQRPRHEPKLATPIEERQYTQGKGCKICGGNLQGKQGTGVVGAHACAVCKGGGWRLDENGKPESPRLYAKQRETDEPLDAFADRMIEEIAAAPDDYLIRGVVVRLEDELPKMRQDLLDQIKIERASALFDVHPRNPDACSKFGSLCSFFAACAGQASIDDEQRFPRGAAHPELVTAA